MRGSGMIKVVGILMIIFGGLGLALGLVALVGISAVVDLANSLGVESNTGLLYGSALLSILGAVVQLVTGIIGVTGHSKPEKMGLLMILSCLMIALVVLNFVLSMIGDSGMVTAILSVVIGMVLPILMITGVKKNA